MAYKKQIGLYLEYANFKGKDFNNEEHFRLLEEATEEEQAEILGEIVTNNLGLVRHLMKKRFYNVHEECQRFRVTLDDLFSVGYYGLMKAAHAYDVSTGIKFATYASRCVMNEFLMFVRSHQRTGSDTSMDNILNVDDTGNELTLGSLIEDPNDYVSELLEEDFGFALAEELGKFLTPQELLIAAMYLREEDSMNQGGIAKAMGLSQSYVSRIITRATAKIKKKYLELEKA